MKKSLTKQPNIFQKLDETNEVLKKAGKTLIIALDEVQNLRFYGIGGRSIVNLFAHTYDHLQNIKFVITGSEVGLLHDFLKLDDPVSPMYGRYIDEINLTRFKKEKSVDFLMEGFRQANMEIKKDEIERAINVLDGMVGYLVIYGYVVYTKKEYKGAINKAVKMAENLVKYEIGELDERSENYKKVLKAVAFGMESFSKIKKYIQTNYGDINDQTLSNNINSLVKQSFLEYEYRDRSKFYKIPDPIVKRVVLSLQE